LTGAEKCLADAAAAEGSWTGEARIINILSFFGTAKSSQQDITTVDGSSIWAGDGVCLTSNATRMVVIRLMMESAIQGPSCAFVVAVGPTKGSTSRSKAGCYAAMAIRPATRSSEGLAASPAAHRKAAEAVRRAAAPGVQAEAPSKAAVGVQEGRVRRGAGRGPSARRQ
jgi:hypothetical protein